MRKALGPDLDNIFDSFDQGSKSCLDRADIKLLLAGYLATFTEFYTEKMCRFLRWSLNMITERQMPAISPGDTLEPSLAEAIAFTSYFFNEIAFPALQSAVSRVMKEVEEAVEAEAQSLFSYMGSGETSISREVFADKFESGVSKIFETPARMSLILTAINESADKFDANELPRPLKELESGSGRQDVEEQP